MKNMKVDRKSQTGTGNLGNQVAPVAAVPHALDLPYARTAEKFATDLPVTMTTSAAPSLAADLPHFVNTISETAFVLKCSDKSVRRLIDRNLLCASKGLRHVRITRQAILAYLKNTSE
jgi:excisionase family DNA binding protein